MDMKAAVSGDGRQLPRLPLLQNDGSPGCQGRCIPCSHDAAEAAVEHSYPSRAAVVCKVPGEAAAGDVGDVAGAGGTRGRQPADCADVQACCCCTDLE